MTTTLQPVAAPEVSKQLDAILHRAAIAPLDSKAWLRVTGSDATRWLNGMVTNNISTLAPGEGNYNFLLNAQGRILGDCTIYREPNSSAFLLLTDGLQVDSIRQHLEKFIIMDDVELEPAPSNLHGYLLIGPGAPETVHRYYNWFLRGARLDLTPLRTPFLSETGDQLITLDAPLVPRIEIFTSESDRVIARFSELGAVRVSPEALEALRILEGRPRYGTDIRNTESSKDLPQETAQTHALHFAKGCYLGQEIVERIRSRGNVHRTFTGFQLTGTAATPGTILQAEGKPAGELTSISTIDLPSGHLQLALGYIRREALERNLALEYPGGTATPIKLPYNPASTTPQPNSSSEQ